MPELGIRDDHPMWHDVDFEEIARRLVGSGDVALVRENLRFVWNARGVADRHAVEQVSPFPLDATQQAIRSVDR